MVVLTHAAEIKPVDELQRPPVQVGGDELKMAMTLGAAMTPAKFDFSRYVDTYQENLKMLIEAKVAGKEITAPHEVPSDAPAITNLMEALQRSVAEAKGKGGKPAKLVAPSTTKKPARKRKTS